MSQDSMTSGWYYSKAGAQAGHEVGPLSWEELYLLAQNGTVGPTDTVWNLKLPRGMAAGTLPELFPGLEATQEPSAGPDETPTPPAETLPLEAAAPADIERTDTPFDAEEASPRPDDKKPRKALPLLVVLLVLVLAAAGVAVYFLYFR